MLDGYQRAECANQLNIEYVPAVVHYKLTSKEIDSIRQWSNVPSSKKLTFNEIQEIKQYFQDGYSKSAIAKKYDVSVNTISYWVGKKKRKSDLG
ncbi:helix-turn-helix domain-containing protein [Eubacterium aggregans]|uniref:helix-turn-helix domain-containing protein n=1 Tax=Eubacterium aggregans TaxID=81409 RepID=UPI003F2F2D20